MKRTLSTALFIIALAYSTTAFTYVLSNYAISDEDKEMPAEQVLEKYKSEVNSLDVNLHKLEEHHRNRKIRLTKRERGAITKYRDLKIPIKFWQYVIDLKKSLVNLLGEEANKRSLDEADLLAKTIINKIYRISQEYKIEFSALFSNFLVNQGLEKKGLCYHYVRDLIHALSDHRWKYFDFHWGIAYEGTFRENNSLVITANDMPFNSGIAVDSWRSAGRPYWNEVKGDRFPWVEIYDEDLQEKLEKDKS